MEQVIVTYPDTQLYALILAGMEDRLQESCKIPGKTCHELPAFRFGNSR